MKAYKDWEIGYSTYNPGGIHIETLIKARPVAGLPEKVRDPLVAVFGRPDAVADLDVVRSWVDRPAGRCEHRPPGTVLLHLLPHLQTTREVANLLGWDAALSAERGDTGRALDDLRTMAMLARSFGDDPITISQFVRVAVGTFGTKQLERVLAQADAFDAKQLAALQAEYLSEAERPLLLWLARGERAIGQHDAAILRDNPDERKKLIARGVFRKQLLDTGFPWLNKLLQYRLPDSYFFPASAGWPNELAALLEYHNAFAEIAKRHEREWLSAVQALPTKEKMPPFSRSWLWSHWVISRTWEKSPFERHIRVVLLYRAHLRSAAAAIAAERYRLDHGRWPADLQALVPTYLPDVPVDPYTQGPLLWKVLPDGLVIYSVGWVGPKEDDDGGDVLGKGGAAPRDTGIRLWSVPVRKQPPIPYEPVKSDTR